MAQADNRRRIATRMQLRTCQQSTSNAQMRRSRRQTTSSSRTSSSTTRDAVGRTMSAPSSSPSPSASTSTMVRHLSAHCPRPRLSSGGGTTIFTRCGPHGGTSVMDTSDHGSGGYLTCPPCPSRDHGRDLYHHRVHSRAQSYERLLHQRGAPVMHPCRAPAPHSLPHPGQRHVVSYCLGNIVRPDERQVVCSLHPHLPHSVQQGRR
jgi:hypothetical protein